MIKKTITTEKLQGLRKGNVGFLLIDVLAKAAFAKDHIPGAYNVPLDTPDFAKAVAVKAAGSKGRRVVLYCSGPDCDASSKGARLLVEGGFTDVHEYEGGIAAWNESKQARLARNAKAKA
jgi:rhodanese-related sulfurtransferase